MIQTLLRKSIPLFILFLLMGIVGASVPSTHTITTISMVDGTTLYVGGSGFGNYTRIQDAIDNASDGDTIRVFDGTYYENVGVNKRINLIGNGSMTTIIDGGYTDHQHVVSITTGKVNMSGFGIKNSYMGHEFGGIGIQSSNNRIFNNHCWNNLYGVILFGGQNMIYNNSISNNKRDGIYIKSSGNVIDNNKCSNSSERDGIWLYICMNNIISNNTCSQNNKNGITLYKSPYNRIFNNICSNSTLFNGILIYESSNNEFCNNNLSFNNDDGIGISHFSDKNKYINNTIIKNRIGVDIKDNCSYNTVYHNNFIRNTENAFDECNNSWDNGYPSGGNYWDDYTGNDSNGDGIGDTPYNISGGDNQDRYPLMEPWDPSNKPPYPPDIDGPTYGTSGEELTYTFVTEDPEEDFIFYFVEWGDGNTTGWIGYYESGEEINRSHSWSVNGTYEIRAKAKDIWDNESGWSVLELRIGNHSPDEPKIENITITPEKPNPQSEITFKAEIIGKNLEEVYMIVEESNDWLCYPDMHNVSMENIGTNTYECNVTLIHEDATVIQYWLVIKCNGTWYDFREERKFHDIYPELNISSPEKGCFHIFGKPITKTFLGNTVLIGRIKIIIDVGSYLKEDIEKVEFYINEKLKGTVQGKPFEWLWKTFSFGKSNIEIKAYVSETNYSSVKTQVIAFIL